ncbi:MAG: hypothetical protein Q8K82_08605 [Gemmatimonadaceae bacterium]|nr:hypothetical protein [Gemmatimonadaceae bacterium]
MTREEFTAAFRIGQPIASDGVKTSLGQEVRKGRLVLVHELSSSPGEQQRILLLLKHLPPKAAELVVLSADVGGEHVVVTKFLLGFVSLRDWLERANAEHSTFVADTRDDVSEIDLGVHYRERQTPTGIDAIQRGQTSPVPPRTLDEVPSLEPTSVGVPAVAVPDNVARAASMADIEAAAAPTLIIGVDALPPPPSAPRPAPATVPPPVPPPAPASTPAFSPRDAMANPPADRADTAPRAQNPPRDLQAPSFTELFGRVGEDTHLTASEQTRGDDLVTPTPGTTQAAHVAAAHPPSAVTAPMIDQAVPIDAAPESGADPSTAGDYTRLFGLQSITPSEGDPSLGPLLIPDVREGSGYTDFFGEGRAPAVPSDSKADLPALPSAPRGSLSPAETMQELPSALEWQEPTAAPSPGIANVQTTAAVGDESTAEGFTALFGALSAPHSRIPMPMPPVAPPTPRPLSLISPLPQETSDAAQPPDASAPEGPRLNLGALPGAQGNTPPPSGRMPVESTFAPLQPPALKESTFPRQSFDSETAHRMPPPVMPQQSPLVESDYTSVLTPARPPLGALRRTPSSAHPSTLPPPLPPKLPPSPLLPLLLALAALFVIAIVIIVIFAMRGK